MYAKHIKKQLFLSYFLTLYTLILSIIDTTIILPLIEQKRNSLFVGNVNSLLKCR